MATQPETTEQATFYSPWPRLGRRFSSQLDEVRHNFEALHPVVRAVGLDDDVSATPLKDQAVQSVEFGEDGFHNKYRLFWDKTNLTFRLQINSGTTNVPAWQDRLTIGSSGELVGNFYVPTAGTHGDLAGLGNDDHTQYLLASAAGSRAAFAANWTDLTDGGATTLHSHTSSGITVKQSDDVESFTGITKLSFETASFYITQNADPTIAHINFRGTAGSGGGGGVTDHGALGGLTPDDDHPQYLLVDGTRAMSGHLDMGGKDIINASDARFTDIVTAEAFYIHGGGMIQGYGTPDIGIGVSQKFDSIYITEDYMEFVTQKSGTIVPTLRLTSNQARFVTDVNAEAFYLSSQRGEVYAYDFNREHFYVEASTQRVGRYTVNLAGSVGGASTSQITFTTDDLGGSFTPKEYTTSTLKFNRSDFYLTPDSTGNPIVNLAGSRPLGRALAVLGTAHTITTGTPTTLSGYISALNVGGWTIGTDSITIPAGVSVVKATAQIQWAADVDGTRALRIFKNGAVIQTNGAVQTEYLRSAGSAAPTYQATSWSFDVVPGDTISIQVEHSAGNDLAASASLSWLYVEEVRVSSGGGLNSIIVKESTSPDYSTTELNFNSTDFYLTSTSGGKPMVNLVGATGSSGGTALTVEDQLAPAYTNVSNITFDNNFYLTPDSTGQPIVNFVNQIKAVTVAANTAQNIAENSTTTVVFQETIQNIGNWSVSLATGEITVPSGVTHVKLLGSVRFVTITTDAELRLSFRVNGAGTLPLFQFTNHVTGNMPAPSISTFSSLIPVVAGDVLSMAVFQNQISTTTAYDTSPGSGATRVVWFAVEGYNFG